MKCSVPDCPCSVWSGSEDLCFGHFQKKLAEERKEAKKTERKEKKDFHRPGRPRTQPKYCTTEGCLNPPIAKGLCSACYQRIRRQFG